METPSITEKDLTLTKKWFFIGLISLVLVAVLGTTMRAKILYNIPFLMQKHLIHAHSHYAFSGWVTHILFIGLYLIIRPKISQTRRKFYHWMIGLNLISALGMLVWFTIQGYKAISITFSTMSILVVVLFVIGYIKDIRQISFQHEAKKWAVTALLLNILSSIGPFLMAYFMATHTKNIIYTNSSIYYYLHMQYNGWFLFASIALIAALVPNLPKLKPHFIIMTATIIPSYILSVLSLNIPTWMMIVGAISGILQLLAWLDMIRLSLPVIKQHTIKSLPIVKFLFYTATVAITIKFILQAMSVIPSLSHLIFGMRPIIIGYLHLVLLAGFSLFLIGYMIYKNYMVVNRLTKIALYIFVTGVILNEAALALQGLSAFYYFLVPNINQSLLVAAFLLLIGAICLMISQIKKKDQQAITNENI